MKKKKTKPGRQTNKNKTAKPRKKSKSKRPSKSVNKFKLARFCNQTYSELLGFCHQVVKNYQKNRHTLLVSLLVVALLTIFAGLGPSSQNFTLQQANQKFINDYGKVLSTSYPGLVKQSLNDAVQGYSAMLQPLGQLLARVFAGTGEIFYQLRHFKVAISDTVQAYSALLQPVGKLLADVFDGSGDVLAVVSYTISTPARVMAMTAR